MLIGHKTRTSASFSKACSPTVGDLWHGWETAENIKTSRI